MAWWQWIITIASIIGAVVTIIGTAYKYLIKPCMALVERFKQMEVYQKWAYHNTLRLLIMSEEMPIEERIAAGDKYVNEEHLNGKIKRKYENLIDQWERDGEA